MEIQVRAYTRADLPDLIRIWNEVVEDGVAFPQEDLLDASSGADFFAEQTYTAVAEERQTGRICGLYILHPNNVGRCGHICNASYAVERTARGLHIGEKLVSDCLKQGRAHASASCNSTPSSPATRMRGTCMSALVFILSASSPAASA